MGEVRAVLRSGAGESGQRRDDEAVGIHDLSESELKTLIDKLENTPWFPGLPDEDRRDAISEAIRDYLLGKARSNGKGYIFGNFWKRLNDTFKREKRRAKKRREFDDPRDAHSEISELDRIALWDALLRQPEEAQNLITAIYFMKLSCREIAALNLFPKLTSENGVRARRDRVLEALRLFM